MLYFNPKEIMGFWGFPAETLLTICWKLMIPAGHPNLWCIDHEYEYDEDHDYDDHVRHHEGSSIIECSPYAQG